MFLVKIGRGAVSLLRSRILWVLLAAVLCCGTLLHQVFSSRFVTVYDFEGEGLIHFRTASTGLTELLEEAGVTLGEYDTASFSGPGLVMEIEIDRSYPVYVTADGSTSRVYVNDCTVSEALELCGVELGTYDEVSEPLNRVLSAGEEINVTRVSYSDSFYTEEIDYGVETRLTSLLRTGSTRKLSSGSPGEKQVFHRDKYVDGSLVSSYIQNELVTVEPVDTVTLQGQTGYAISPYEPFEGVTTDASGRPTNAVKVYTNMRGVSYCTGSVCASGLPAQVGHIGVNPKVFPYGTKLYIESADGSFVYGYCIAADCGAGTLNNVIDVDLFYDSYYECSLMGRHNDLVIYVLPD